jgi:hypothetical protein
MKYVKYKDKNRFSKRDKILAEISVRRRQMVSTPVSCSGGLRFKSRSEDRLS